MFPNLTFTLEGGSSFSSNIKYKEPECLRPPSRPGMMHAAVSSCMCGCMCVCVIGCVQGGTEHSVMVSHVINYKIMLFKLMLT